MTIYRGAGGGDRFTMILNSALQDRRLSYRARGVLAAVMSRPPGWKTTANRIADEGLEGREAVLVALRELTECEYLRRTRRRDSKGRWTVDWELTDKPELLKPAGRDQDGFPDAGSPDAGSPAAGGPDAGSPAAGGPDAGSPAAGGPDAGPCADKPLETQGETQRKTEEKTPPPPPTPAGDVEGLAVDELERVVVGELRKAKAPIPGRPELRKQCARLHQLQWTAVQLAAAVEGHDWHGARAGAVITHLRHLQSPPSSPVRPAGRPDWCGACEEITRLITDPDSGTVARCPNCHPKSRKDTA